MDEKKFLSGTCPNCGKVIQVPGELEHFSCVYCGQRLTPADLNSQNPVEDPLSPEERKALAEDLANTLPGAVTNHLNVFKHFTKKAYPKYFDSYLDRYQVTFDGIAVLCAGKVGAVSAAELAEAVVAALDQWADRSRGKLTSKDGLLDEIKYTLCLLTLPAILSQAEKACQVFCEALHQAWLRAYPKNGFQLVSYEQIMEGFRPRKLCYITTAVCHQAGKPDNCPELTAFRRFRDGYLSAQPHGCSRIEQYYDLAPGICMAIDFCHDPNAVYPAVWEQYLSPCYEALNRGDNAACEEIYTKMVQQLSSSEGLRLMRRE